MNLNTPTIEPGLISAADLDKARQHSAGTIWHQLQHPLLRCPPCNGDCALTGGECRKPAARYAKWADTMPVIPDACAPEGGRHAEPVPSKTTRDVTGARVGAVILLMSAVTVVGVISAAVLARWPLTT